MRSRSWLGNIDFAPALLVVAGLAWACAGCADFHRGPAPVDGGGGKDVAAALVNDPAFEISVYPILLVQCGDCHAAGREAGGSRFVLTGNARLDRAMVVALVIPGDPANSELLIQGAGGHLHPGLVRLPEGTAEYATVSDWIWSLPPAP
jgi:hypothetical protein